MRNTRSFDSAFHAEIKNRKTNQYFESEYYPINFIASDRFVFFNTLYQHSGTGLNLASKAATWLYGPMRNPTRDFRGQTNTKYQEALNFLESAAEVEYVREEAFLEKFTSKSPELKELIEKCKGAGSDKYFNLINALNLALKGKKRYEAELNKEIKRIDTRQIIMKNDERALKEGRHVAVKKDSNKEKLTAEEYRSRNELNGDDTFGDTVLNPYFNFDGKKIFDTMFKRNSDFSIFAEKIIVGYGSRLIEARSGKLHLNKSQSVALIKVLIQEAYNTLAIEYQEIFNKIQGESRSARRDRIAKQIDKIMAPGGHLDTFFNNFINSPDPSSALTSIAEQNGIPIDNSKMKELGHSTKTFNSRLKKIYEQEKATGKTNKTYISWKREKGFTKKDVEEFIYMMANVNVEMYYTNEGMAVADAVSNDMFAGVGGAKNAPTDVNAGKIVCTFSYEEYPEAVQKVAKKLISEAEQKMSQAQMKMISQQNKVTDTDSYINNIKALKQMQKEQKEILETLKASLEQLGIDVQDMISHINIHETIKGYASIDATTDMFEGAAFGTRITDQIGIINKMLGQANISPLDADWLVFALINCGEGMIGADNKHALEDYLSGYVGMLMFSDASFIAQDVYDQLNNTLTSDISNIHLYILNNKYVPSSYILHETYKAMSQFLKGIENQTHGTVLSLTTYKSPNAYLTFPNASWSLEDLQGPAWQKESTAAIEATHLTMYFLSNFMGLLQQLQSQLQSI